jgi:hypothetical protein
MSKENPNGAIASSVARPVSLVSDQTIPHRVFGASQLLERACWSLLGAAKISFALPIYINAIVDAVRADSEQAKAKAEQERTRIRQRLSAMPGQG